MARVQIWEPRITLGGADLGLADDGQPCPACRGRGDEECLTCAGMGDV